MSILGSIAGGVASSLVGSMFGGGSQTPSQATIPGVKFQPVTYTGSTGTVTGTPQGAGYEWSADVSPWISDLGALGSAEAGGMFQKYLQASQVDPYAAAEEYYSRGLGMLEPEIAKQRAQLGGSLYGSGRLGLQLAGQGLGYGTGSGAVNPDVAGFGAGVGKAYTNLYANALQAGQDLQTNYIDQLSSAANAMFKLGMTPAEVEQNLINFTKDLEVSRSNAMKAGVQQLTPQETTQSVLAGQLAKNVGKGVTGYFNQGAMGLPTSYSSGSPWMSAGNQTWVANIGGNTYNPNAGGGLFSPF